MVTHVIGVALSEVKWRPTGRRTARSRFDEQLAAFAQAGQSMLLATRNAALLPNALALDADFALAHAWAACVIMQAHHLMPDPALLPRAREHR